MLFEVTEIFCSRNWSFFQPLVLFLSLLQP